MQVIILSVLLVAFIMSAISISLAVWALIQIEAFKRSTHQVMMIDPNKQKFTEFTEEDKREILKDHWEEDLIK